MEWQPIETAPKDGGYILLHEKWTNTPFIGFYCDISKCWFADKQHINVYGDGVIDDDFKQGDITHWMELPDAPKDTP